MDKSLSLDSIASEIIALNLSVDELSATSKEIAKKLRESLA